MDKLEFLVAEIARRHEPPPEVAEAVRKRVTRAVLPAPDPFLMVKEIFRQAFAVCERFSICADPP
jgi:hypothetical protein